MGAKLLFESRLIHHVMRQEGRMESAPVISMRLEMTDGPVIYASGGAVLKASAWGMQITRCCDDVVPATHIAGTIRYVATEPRPLCVIELEQSPDRFAALLDMFKGGHASEITVLVDDLADKADYSKEWNTSLQSSIAITSICFEFPLPQSEA